MRVNGKSFVFTAVSVLLVAVITGFAISGCGGGSTTSSSTISGVVSVPITGAQIYETKDDSFGDDYGAAQSISYGDTAYGLIDSSGDVDFFAFAGTASEEIIIDIDAEAIGSALDSYIELFDDPLGTAYDANDDYPDDAAHDPSNYIFTLDSHLEIASLPSSGTYYIKVQSYDGYSSGSYQLRLFKIASGGGLVVPASSKEVDFVPDEIIVKYKRGYDAGSIKSLAEAGGYSVVSNDNNIYKGAPTLLKLSATRKSLMSEASIRESTLAEIKRLNSLPYVEYAEPNYIMKPLFTPDDPYYTFNSKILQWHYPLIKLDMVWEENLVNDVSSVIVAVIDTGVGRSNGTKTGQNHEDLGNFVDEYDFIKNENISLDGDGMDPDATDPGDDPSRQFSSFHGTHVTGTIAALTNNNTGVAGVAGGNDNGVKIMPLRVLGAGGGTVLDIADAVLYAAGLDYPRLPTPSKRADIINMSLGAPADSITLRNAITDAFNEGVLIIASAGNEGTSVAFYPAAYDNVISVSAVGPGGELAPYSSFGGTIDISAPGGDTSMDINFDGYADGVLSTLFSQNGSTYTPIYTFYQGTSMAAPHVSGVAALLKAANGSLTNTGLRTALLNTAIDVGQAGYDIYYGHGLLNAYAAVKSVLGPDENPVLYPFPRALKFEGQAPAPDSITLKNIGGSGTITINSITEANDPENLVSNINPSSGAVDEATDLNVVITLDTSGLEDGNDHYARLKITYDTIKKEYVYIMYNRSGFPVVFENEDIGNVFVVAYDAKTFTPVAQAVTKFNQWYTYTIQDLQPGNYIIVAGTDRDSDLSICDDGETYGFYPLFGFPVTIKLGSGIDLTGIDFKASDGSSGGFNFNRLTRK
jgi:serine protease